MLTCLASLCDEHCYQCKDEQVIHNVSFLSAHSCLLCSLSIFDDVVDVFDSLGDCLVLVGCMSDVMTVLVEQGIAGVLGTSVL